MAKTKDTGTNTELIAKTKETGTNTELFARTKEAWTNTELIAKTKEAGINTDEILFELAKQPKTPYTSSDDSSEESGKEEVDEIRRSMTPLQEMINSLQKYEVKSISLFSIY